MVSLFRRTQSPPLSRIYTPVVHSIGGLAYGKRGVRSRGSRGSRVADKSIPPLTFTQCAAPKHSGGCQCLSSLIPRSGLVTRGPPSFATSRSNPLLPSLIACSPSRGTQWTRQRHTVSPGSRDAVYVDNDKIQGSILTRTRAVDGFGTTNGNANYAGYILTLTNSVGR